MLLPLYLLPFPDIYQVVLPKMSLLNEISVRWTVRERPSLWSYILLTRQNIINLDPQKCTSIQKGFISWVELQIQEFTVKIFYETSRSRDNLVTNHMTTSRDTILIYTCTYPRNFCQRRIWIKTRWLIGNIRTSINQKWKCSLNRALRTDLPVYDSQEDPVPGWR